MGRNVRQESPISSDGIINHSESEVRVWTRDVQLSIVKFTRQKIACVYCCPSLSSKKDSQLIQALMRTITVSLKILIMGDFNLPHMKWNVASALGGLERENS